MTFLELQTNVKAWLGDRDDIATATLKREINNQYKRLAIPFRFHQTEKTDTSITTVSGTQEYSLSSLGEVYEVPVVRDTTNDRKLEQRTIEWFENLDDPDDTGYPMHYILYGDDNMILYPVPDGAYSLRLRYKALPTDLSADGDTPIYPSDWHQIIEYGAASKLAFMYNMDERGMMLKNMEMNELGTRLEPGTLDRKNIPTTVDVRRTRRG